MRDNVFVLVDSKFYLSCILILLLLFFLYLWHKKHIFRIWRWQKLLNLKEHAQVFARLFQPIDGFTLSRQARQKQDAIEYTYGEIEFLPFIALLSLAKPDTNTVFYDLGSGIGKAVLACAMVYPVSRSVGIELLPELYQSACNQSQQLATMQNYTQKAQKIDFVQGDFFEVDLNDATLIFINSTALIGEVWQTLCSRLNNLPHLSCVITTSKPLISENFFVIKRTTIQMSWGVVQSFINMRKTNFH